MGRIIRVLVVDDSAFMRRVISDMLNDEPDIEVVMTASDGVEAVERCCRERPDVVTMDIAINRLSKRTQTCINVVTSILCAIICLVITWYGAIVWWDYFQIDYLYAGSLKIPAYLLEIVIPIGGFLLFIQFLRKAYNYLEKLKAS